VATFVLAGAALAATGWLLCCMLRLDSPAEFLLGWWVVACAELVAAAEILSLAHAISPLGYALVEAAALVLALAAWLRLGRPLPPRALVRGRPLDGLLTLLALVVTLAVGYELFLIVATPPNNWDSMHYHLARVAAWRAQRSLAYVPTHNAIENAYPQNAELLVLWTVVLVGRDVVAALPQLLSCLATATAVYAIARRLGYNARLSAFAGLLFPTLTIVALESVTTQNDLVEASFISAAVALALGRSRSTAVLAGAAVGLAAGTKLTFLYALPVLVVIGLLALPRRRLAAVAAASVVAVVLVGAYAYVQNIVETGRPEGRSSEVTGLVPAITLAGTVSTVARTTYRLIDASAFHVPTRVLEPISDTGKSVFRALGIPANPASSTAPGAIPFDFGVSSSASEDSSAFGPLGVLLLLPLSLGFLVAWIARRTDRLHGSLALALPLYLVALALGTRWNFYVDRFLITPAALTLPLAPAVLGSRILRIAVLGVAVATVALALAYDVAKPSGLSGVAAVWDRDRVAAETIQRADLRNVLEAVERRVPQGARLGVDLAPGDWEYPLWGARLGRRLVWLPEQSPGGLRWVVLGTRISRRPAGTWCATRFRDSHWTLLRRC